ncbi:MAG TPA: ABC transporter substrate-binding protein [Ornithinimicrobium sp.]|uniref:ABC transporter substrate-binding protein n=1 Tax=Ornithinimicrobium sp. TaxID=1977084 RepID=UPI002B4638FB|nr:ABC transporter substrate-binding protein [Ornithinimicrobium sp.]HKJ11691.1 ABC transporter substrate-binding protein [Ornithinimicrobium sp.]
MFSSSRRALGAVVATAFALSACNAGSGSGDSGSGSGSDTSVSIGLVAEPASLDFTTTDGAAIPQALLYNVYETLVKVDSQSGEIVASLATDYEVSEDGKTYTFALVEDATFSDGAAFGPEDVVFSIERVQSEAWTVSLKSQMEVVDTVEVTGDHEVTVTLTRPDNSWLYAMTTQVGAMFDTEGTEDLAGDPIGTGPYTFADWDRGTDLTLRRHEGYWGPAPFFEEVTLAYFDDGNALNNALLSDRIDVVGTVQAPESLADFEDGDYQVIEGTTNGEVVLSFNNDEEPFSDKRVRQAARHAIDHPTLLDTCWAGRGELIGSMVPPTDPWYEDRTGDYEFDVEKAKDLLEEADATGVRVRLRIPTLPYAVACGTVVESMLEDAGFEVKVEELEFPATWLEEVFTAHDYDMSIVAHVEPRDMRAVFGNPDYYTGYGTGEIVTLLDEADAGTREEQNAKMAEAAQLISEDAAADFLFLLPNLVVAQPDITGLPENSASISFELAPLARE